MNKNILVIAAHPDDELLGCGGTLLYYKRKGYEVKIVFLSDGESARKNLKDKKKILIKKREEQAIKISKICKFKKPSFGRFPDNQLDKIPLLTIIRFIEREIDQFKPQIIFTHNEHDLNIDHQIVFKSVLTATRPSTKTFVKSIYCFETPSSTENNFSSVKVKFNPNLFFDITKFIDKKIKLLKIYKNELGKYPHPRSLSSIKVLAKYRGTQIGSNYAESFFLLRRLEN